MNTKQVLELLDKYRSGTCTQEEKALLESWYLHCARTSEKSLTADDLEKALDDVESSLFQKKRSTLLFCTRLVLRRIVAAALILITFTIGFYKYQGEQTDVIVAKPNTEILAGRNKAILILGNGSQIDLEEADNGLLAIEGQMTIMKTSDGELSYNSTAGASSSMQVENLTNTIEIPKGGVYKVVLSDGSEVWLNSVSSLSYPIAFTGNEREVELVGEAYFEIAADELKPFHVKSINQVVEVLGTQFNINSYEDDGFVKTTLIEGSVKVIQQSSNGKPLETQLLKPGQQSLINLSKAEIREVDIEKEVAWKNGYFKFKDSDIQDIMQQVGRWYDVEVQFEGEIPTNQYTGFISRDIKISKMLTILEESGGIEFTIQDRIIKIKST